MAGLAANPLKVILLQAVKDNGTYLALYTSNPTAADTGTEVSGGAYARQPISFGAISGNAMSNAGAITFTLPNATVTHWGLRTAVTGGSLLIYGTVQQNSVDTPLYAITGDTITFAAGDIDITA